MFKTKTFIMTALPKCNSTLRCFNVWNTSAVLLLFLTGLVLGPYDYTFLLILQLSCVLHMVPFWETRSKLRVMQIVETDGMNYKVLEIRTVCFSDAIFLVPSSPLRESGHQRPYL